MTKDEARANTAASRARRSMQQLEIADRALAAHDWQRIIAAARPGASRIAPVFVTCYSAMFGEPPTAATIAALTHLGCRVALPIMSPGRRLSWGWHTSELRCNSYGVLQPDPDLGIQLDYAAALIIPAQRVGLDGSRLGRGAGYYDRALADTVRWDNGGPMRIAMVFDDEVDSSVPHDPWDQPIDLIVTPQRMQLIDG